MEASFITRRPSQAGFESTAPRQVLHMPKFGGGSSEQKGIAALFGSLGEVARLLEEASLDALDVIGQSWIMLSFGVDLANCMHDGRVVSATEIATDLLQAVSGVPTGEPHADLTGEGNRLVAALGEEVREFDVVVVGYGIDDRLDRWLTAADPILAAVIRESGLRQFKGDGLAGRHCKTSNSSECPLEFANVRIHLGSDIRGDILWKLQALYFRFRLENGDACFVTRSVHARDKPTVESTDQAFLEVGNVVWRRIRTENDLSTGLIERVEGVERTLPGSAHAWKESGCRR